MGEKTFNGSEGDRLRYRAVEWLGEQNGAGEEFFRLIHELQAQRDELERRNQELLRAIDQRDRLVLMLSSINDHRESAPMGYLALTRNGTIRAVNLTAASFLGFNPSHLLSTSLYYFVEESDHASFRSFLETVFDKQCKQACELTLLEVGGTRHQVRMETIVIESEEECLLAVSEITEDAAHTHGTGIAYPRIKQLEGIIPICAYCKRIRDDHEIWQQLERYISEHSEALFSHGVCPECSEKVLAAIKR